MEVILKQSIEKLGEEGDQVKVANGYARNYLLPKGLAIQATKQHVAALQREKNIIEQRLQREMRDAQRANDASAAFAQRK